MLKIVLAPGSYKGSMTAVEACDALARGVRRAAPDAEIVSIPMADGGEGTTLTLIAATGGELSNVEVTGPLPSDRPTVTASIGLLDGRSAAVLEMASASGLPLVPREKRDPRRTTTYGTGELIRAALDAGARKLLIGVGGSATNDLGAGMAQALGVKFFRADGDKIKEPLTGASLAEITHIDVSGLHPAVRESQIEVACDVDNPLLGPRGCAAVYGPQKGATPAIVDELEANAARAIDLIEAATGRLVRDAPGAGAAGGLGAGLMAFLGASLRSGVAIVLEASRFAERARGAAVVLTGEGRIDQQSARGKTISGVARAARAEGVPVVAIVGSIGEGVEELYPIGLTSIFSMVPGPITLDDAMKSAGPMLADAAERTVRLLLAAGGVGGPAAPTTGRTSTVAGFER